MHMQTILKVENLHVNFYTNQRCNKALRGISFELKKGRTLCMVGESGCGKSVTANAIMALLPELSRIEEGSITYWENGEKRSLETLKRNGPEIRALRGEEIAMIFQDPMTALNPVFSVGFQINEMLMSHSSMSKKEAIKKSISLLTDMGVPAPDQRVFEYPHQYSGGMRQRAMIAMAMACQPKVLIADEPTTALDVTIQAQIFELMNTLKEEKEMAMMLITHDMGVVAEMADDVAVMYMGLIVESGTVMQVLGNPTHPYTSALLESIPILGKGKSQNLEPIKGTTPDPYNRPIGCQFAPRCKYADEKCHTKMPPEFFVDETHMIRCFKYEELNHGK
ncbi:MAG: ABC transporter ATP-binding protein [Spirochaetia bacterium]|nr:ABC transporter ATP-binding protein [Spirochaetia bacterium]